MKQFFAVVLFCGLCLAQQPTREHPCPAGKHMEGDYDRVYACVPDSVTAQAAPKSDAPTSTTQTTNNLQGATWEPKFDFDDELYPSFVLSMSGRTFKAPANSHYLGDALGLAEVLIRPTAPNTKVHVEIQVEGFSEVSTSDVTLDEASQQYTVAPLIRWNFERLANLNQSVPATVVYKVSINGMEGHETRSVRVRSVNDVPFALVTPEGKPKDLSVLFAAYVNESHPFVQSVLQEALNYRAVNSFSGYQSGPDGVRLQVFALWNVLQRRGLHYSSITTASASSPTGHVYSQAVRFIDQSVRTQQANCVDGAVLFASLLYKIGIQPILVLKPGHMFVGYYLDADHKQFEFLETTLLGAGHQPTITKNIAFSPILHPAQGSESWRQFVAAVQYATNVFSQEVAPAIGQHRPQYAFIDVAKARQLGVNAIPHND